MFRLVEVSGLAHSDLPGRLRSGLCIVLDCAGRFAYIWLFRTIRMSANCSCFRLAMSGRPIFRQVAISPRLPSLLAILSFLASLSTSFPLVLSFRIVPFFAPLVDSDMVSGTVPECVFFRGGWNTDVAGDGASARWVVIFLGAWGVVWPVLVC